MREHQRFLRRQQVFERRYQRQFYAYLASVNANIAKAIIENGTDINVSDYLQPERLQRIYKQLYTTVSLSEAKTEYTLTIKPLGNTKSAIIDLINILSPGVRSGGLVGFWRGLLNEFIVVQIAQRITQVSQTTKKRVAQLIQKGIDENLGAEQVAKIIRDDQNFNKVRSRAISRTETISAGNQGKFMAAQTSPYEMRKRWVSTVDKRSRASHRDMNNTPFIGLDDYFFVANDKGELEAGQYPCDESFSASNTINCRCSISFEAKRDINGRVIRKL